MNESTIEKVLEDILKAIYWKKFTTRESSIVTDIIKAESLSPNCKANEICEILGIEKRGNRSSICSVLNSLENN